MTLKTGTAPTEIVTQAIYDAIKANGSLGEFDVEEVEDVEPTDEVKDALRVDPKRPTKLN